MLYVSPGISTGTGSGSPPPTWSDSYPAGLIFNADPAVDAFTDVVGGTLCTDGTACQVLRDTSVSAKPLSASGGSSKPTFRDNAINGLGCLEFDGVANELGNASFNLSGVAGLTGFSVAKWNVASGLQILFGWQGINAGQAAFLLYVNGGFVQFAVLGTGGSYTVVSTAVADTAWHVFAWRYDSVTGFINTWIDHAADVVNATGPTGPVHDTVNGLNLGQYPGLGDFAAARTGQQLVYGAGLADADVTLTRNMLLAKYAL